MFVDRLNITMVDRENLSNQVDPRQFVRTLKQNSIVATYGHTPGDFRRVFTNEMEGICAMSVPIVGLDSTIETLNASRSGLNLKGHGPNRFMAYTCSYARLDNEFYKNNLHVIREPLLSHYVVYLLHKESILQEVLEKYVALSYQADLYRYWDNFNPLKSLKKMERSELTANVIKFNELMWQFIILPIGGLLGLVAFLLELCWHKIELRRQQLRRN
ncbi:hypothetical protein ZHAS_00003307 [Anopheles sinensis]|uniref:Uncharacterized protein n=1 Tax=Anopheles sinensis TaxID=74873 RepID=A0A084VE14_ANOSI|nr:hypothetical protein ZHAS_00003307 [Anopheles sinensis]